MRVDFIIPGAMKCGTTTLAKILSKHPEISFCKKKEPQFFAYTTDWKKDIEDYHALYRQKEGVIYGEASTNYTKYPDGSLNTNVYKHYNYELWNLIYEYNPGMKFVYLVRNPMDRIISQYIHLYIRGFTELSLEKAVLKLPDLMNTSRYYAQISPFINKFGIENVLIVDFDDLVGNTKSTIHLICSFLNIDFSKYDEGDFSVWSNSWSEGKKISTKITDPTGVDLLVKKVLPGKIWSKYSEKYIRKVEVKPELTPVYQNIIKNMLKSDIMALENITKKDLSHWYKM